MTNCHNLAFGRRPPVVYGHGVRLKSVSVLLKCYRVIQRVKRMRPEQLRNDIWLSGDATDKHWNNACYNTQLTQLLLILDSSSMLRDTCYLLHTSGQLRTHFCNSCVYFVHKRKKPRQNLNPKRKKCVVITPAKF
jgi:hypothetical protein